MTGKVELKFASAEDVEEFYGGPPLFSCRAVIARLDGKPVGLGGVYRCGKTMVVFTEIREEMRPHKKAIIRAARMVLNIINRYTTVVAYADPDQQTADTFGSHFNFEKTGVTFEGRTVMARVNNGPN